MPQRVKAKKMDPNFVSFQKHEIQYIANRFKISVETVKKVVRVVGKSRKRVYSEIRKFA